jgi:hypothetical protein
MSVEKHHDGSPLDEGEAEPGTAPPWEPLSGNSAAQQTGAHSLASWKALRRSIIFIALALIVATLIYNSRYSVQGTPLGPPVSFLSPAGVGCALDSAWSPSGRYIVDGLSVNGLLLSSGESLPSRSVLDSLQLDPVMTLPIRDAGLQQFMVQDIPLPVSLGLGLLNDIVPIAWRPDGKVVAILNESNGFILRATDTGRILEVVNSVQLAADGLPPAGTFAILPSWSPDGTWLLLPSLVLVDVGHLPASST